MNREIKFRGKRLDNGEWVYGCLTRYSEAMSYIKVDVVAGIVHQVSAETVGQYTGYSDSQDNEVWEGDIVDFTTFDHNGNDYQHRAFVEYVGSRFLLLGKHKGETEQWDLEAIYDDCESEITGNVHDNPGQFLGIYANQCA